MAGSSGSAVARMFSGVRCPLAINAIRAQVALTLFADRCALDRRRLRGGVAALILLRNTTPP
ncbi:hypothetical protein EYB53_019680 [Candidatus Chloroploca sp. M-50]|uniref:Uncharacterized protein n=1 Tax=Candidatus Chloroploca mongolica TaxID=2528176 RepID=A0ABS4DER3_9CHLR|nr:hypothetical protein [Candidatus Chloroploca mongolica]MBP1467947.1 hypothetical protein [Candidatus Chloroploca mongolica]